MKRNILFVLFIASLTISVYAQVETHFYKKGELSHNPWQIVPDNSNVKQMPSYDLAQLQKEEALKNDTNVLFQFGKGFDVSYTLSDGQWEEVKGGRLWSMTFASEGAQSLNFVFNDFYIPQGSELYIENEDKSVLYGPVTATAVPENGFFLTDIIPGDQATIYLYEPDEYKNQASLTITRVVHGYRTDNIMLSHTANFDTPSLYVDSYPDYIMVSDGVGFVITSDGTTACNGALVMTADYSFKPYFLTVLDLVDNNEDGIITDTELSFAQNSAFKFRHRTTNNQGLTVYVNYTYNHATLRSAWNTTKYALLEINGSLKDNPNLSWFGWDRSGTSPTSAACIFWPEEYDGKRIIFDSEFTHNTNYNHCLGSHSWYTQYDYGSPTLTAAGAPFIDQNKRLIGQLYCLYIPPSTYYMYAYSEAGKFSESWNGDNTSSTALKYWLSPTGNATVMDSYRAMVVKGPNKIISSATYHLQNLPSGMYITWSLSDNYYQNYLQQNANDNTCTINRIPGHELNNATLTAIVRKNGHIVCYISKTINTGNGFDGTYYNGQATVPVDLPSPLYVLPGTLVTITSVNLVGATANQNGGNATPTSWSFNSSAGILQVGMPASAGKTVVARVTCPGGNVYNLPIMTKDDISTYTMSLAMAGSMIEISLNPNNTLLPSEKHLLNGEVWTLKSINATTGEEVFEQKISDTSYSINTTGWKPGVYIINAYVGDTKLSNKVIVKE